MAGLVEGITAIIQAEAAITKYCSGWERSSASQFSRDDGRGRPR